MLDGLPIQTDHNPDYDDVSELATRPTPRSTTPPTSNSPRDSIYPSPL